MTDFFSDIPLWTLLLWGAFTIFISVYYYRPKKWIKEISKVKRWSLITLRTLGLFILGVLLLGILIRSTSREVDKPALITIVDNSRSMLNYEDSMKVPEQAKALLNDFKSSFSDRFNVLNYTLHKVVKNADSLSFDSEKTNIHEVLEDVYNNYYGRNIGAVVLVSDGNYNAGMNPVYTSEKFKKVPFYTLAVGDTIQKVDHLVSNVVANEIAFLNNQFPIEVTIEGNLTNNKAFTASLYRGGKKISEKQLRHSDNDYSISKTTFLVNADQVGVQSYTIKIDRLKEEYNFKNNEKTVYIEVLDDRSQVLLLAEGLHPDIGAIKSVLYEEQNIEVEAMLIKDLPADLEKYDLIVWHSPGLSNNETAMQRLVRLDKPIWYIIGPDINQNVIRQLSIASNIQTTRQSDKVKIAHNTNFKLFDVSDKTKSTMDIFPPLNSNYGSINVGNSADIFGFQRVGAVTKKDPLFFFGKRINEKYAVTYGTGLWSWKLADYQQNKNNAAFQEIISKTVQYLVLKENTSRLRIQLPSIFDTDESIIIGASFYNESFEPITEPTISFEITNEKNEKIDYTFLPSDKSYSLDLGRLSPGTYDWIAKSTYNGETFSKSGSFVVRKLELENQDTKANHTLLSQIATNNNGKFYQLANYESLIEHIKQRDDITSVAYETSTYKKLIDYFWWFVLIITLFTAEWFLRRYSGGY